MHNLCQWFNTSIQDNSNRNGVKITMPISFVYAGYIAQITDQDGFADHGIDNLTQSQLTIKTLSTSRLGWGCIVIGY